MDYIILYYTTPRYIFCIMYTAYYRMRECVCHFISHAMLYCIDLHFALAYQKTLYTITFYRRLSYSIKSYPIAFCFYVISYSRTPHYVYVLFSYILVYHNLLCIALYTFRYRFLHCTFLLFPYILYCPMLTLAIAQSYFEGFGTPKTLKPIP